MPQLLECKGLVKNFGGLNAVDSFDFKIDQGEIVSLIGPNGAGKTTFFNLVTGFYPADAGEINFDGNDLLGQSPYQITELGIARTFQTVRLFEDMSILENVMVGQHCRGEVESSVPSFAQPLTELRRPESARMQRGSWPFSDPA